MTKQYVTILRYITGFPLKEEPNLNSFDDFKENYFVGEERPETWIKYKGRDKKPISFYHRFGKSRKGLTDKTKILVFLRENLEGEVCFKRKKSYNDHWAGHTVYGTIVANVLGKTAEEEWTHWSNSPMEWLADLLIREEILKEKCKGTISHKR